LVDRKLPGRCRPSPFSGSWVEGLRNAPRAESTTAYIRSLLRRLLLDAVLFAGIIVGITSSRAKLLAFARDQAGIQETLVFPLLIGIAVILAAPFFLGVIRVGRKLGQTLAEVVLPAGGENRVDFAAAPRRLFAVTLELVIVIIVGAPLLVLTRPFLPGAQGGALIVLFIGVLGVAFWRSATNLQGHVRAGAEVIVDVLAKQSQGRGSESREDNLKQIEQLLPGLGALTAVRLESSSPAVGRTLAELNLRALTGASVLAITREAGNVVAPAAGEILRAGDVLALTGTQDAIETARTLLGPE
jgi:CPA2 family monovalent cation:H+ antiporter-2